MFGDDQRAHGVISENCFETFVIQRDFETHTDEFSTIDETMDRVLCCGHCHHLRILYQVIMSVVRPPLSTVSDNRHYIDHAVLIRKCSVIYTF